MSSVKVCLDKSTYTDCPQQGYWSQSGAVLPPLDSSETPVYFTASPTLPQSIYGVEMQRVQILLLFKDNSSGEERRREERRRPHQGGPECLVCLVWIAASCPHTHPHTESQHGVSCKGMNTAVFAGGVSGFPNTFSSKEQVQSNKPTIHPLTHKCTNSRRETKPVHC